VEKLIAALDHVLGRMANAELIGICQKACKLLSTGPCYDLVTVPLIGCDLEFCNSCRPADGGAEACVHGADEVLQAVNCKQVNCFYN
jgi:hypothetical protein